MLERKGMNFGVLRVTLVKWFSWKSFEKMESYG